MKGDLSCQHCLQGVLEQNTQGDLQCQNCGRVTEQTNVAEQLNFNNQQLMGEMININKPTFNRFMHSNDRDTVQKRLDYARDKIQELKKLLNVDSDYDDTYIRRLYRVDAAIRVIKLANDRDFFGKGRNLDNYAAAAYYIVLRIKKAPYLLIDFSDKLNVNLFKLARCFLRIVRFLGLQEKLPLIEPTIFILRYCVMLNFPEKTKKIAETAINLVKRMKRDWMSHGRRPSSLCGAAILISAKIHEVPCTTRDICDTVSVCDETIKRRLDQFKQTKTAKLTREEFQQLEEKLQHLEGEEDPPAFSKARIKSQSKMVIKIELKQQLASESERDLEEFEVLDKDEKDEQSQDQPLSSRLNIPTEVLDHQADEIQNELQKVESSQDVRHSDEKKESSLYTDGDNSQYGLKRPRNYVLNEKETLSDISDGEVETFLLSEDEQKIKRLMWIKMNKTWLGKQEFKQDSVNRVIKKRYQQNKLRQKRTKEEPGKAADAFEAITSSKLADKNINSVQLKKLLSDKPVKPNVQTDEIFNAFAYTPQREMPKHSISQIPEQHA